MAGKPRERALVLELEQRCRDHFEDNQHTILDFVCAWQEGGDSLAKLADLVSTKLNLDINAARITYLLRRKFGEEEVKARLAAAREIGAHALLDHALDDIELLDDKEKAPIVRTKNDGRFFIAKAWNRRELGEQKAGVNINLNVGSLHLDAMRVRSIEAGKEQATLGRAPARSLSTLEDSQVSTIGDSRGGSATAGAIDVEHEVLSDESGST